MTRLEKHYLATFVCYLCGIGLDKDYCCSVYEKCPPEVMEQRRQNALKGYKPRPRRQKT